jgi:hypothetical protein
MHGLDVFAADFLERDFLDDARGLVHKGLLGGFDDLDGLVRPVDLADVFWIGDSAPQNVCMLLVQGYVGRNLTLGHEATHARLAGFDHALADLELLFGKPEHLVMRLGELGRHGYLLLGGNRRRGDLGSGGFDPGGWSNPRRHRPVMHIDRPVDIEDPGGVRDFIIRHAHRDDDTATVDRLGVYVSFVLMQPAAEQALP